MKQLSDQELIELAMTDPDEGIPLDDVTYYQHTYQIVDGKTRVYTAHLYSNYLKFSSNPVSLNYFHDIIKLTKKSRDCLYLDKNICTLDLDKILGDYVREKKIRKKEKRLG